MTREHKLALIVGFALLLLVGVLISDHLSAARSSRIDTVVPEQLAVLEGPPVREAPLDPLGPIAGPGATQVAVESAPVSPGPAAMPHIPQSLTQAIEQAGTQPKVVEPVLGGNDLLRDSILANGGRIVTGADGTGVIELVSGNPLPTLAAAPTEAAADTRKAADRTHKVQKDETLYQIAKRYYGSGKHWSRLAEYNNLGKRGEVREGAVIRLPSEGLIEAPPAQWPRPGAPDVRTLAADTRVASTYTVRDGDTLGAIALRLLGTSRRVPELVRANRLEDEDHLVAGMVLRVPRP